MQNMDLEFYYSKKTAETAFTTEKSFQSLIQHFLKNN